MENYLDIKEAAKFLGCHPGTLSRKTKAGEIKAYKRMNKWMFKKEDLEAVYKPNYATI